MVPIKRIEFEAGGDDDQWGNWEGEFWSEVYPGILVKFKRTKKVTIGGETIYMLREATNRIPIPETIACKECGSKSIFRHGLVKGRQRYRCRTCGLTFYEADTLSRMRVAIPVVGEAVGLFYEGLALSAIRRQLSQKHGLYPSDSTVYEWIVRFTKVAIKKAGSYKVNTGRIWGADETVLKVAGGRVREGLDNTLWFWDVIDHDTRFLLASHMSLNRTIRDAETLFERANRRAKHTPKFIITDKLNAYKEGIERVFGAEAIHIQSSGMASVTHNNIIERLHGTIKDRTEVMRGMQNKETAKLIMEGWEVFYNFIRPHEYLRGKTPAEVGGVKRPFTNWLEVVRLGGEG